MRGDNFWYLTARNSPSNFLVFLKAPFSYLYWPQKPQELLKEGTPGKEKNEENIP